MVDPNSININSVSVADINPKDSPDFCDAYVEYAEFKDGTPLNDDELDELNDIHSDFVYDMVIDNIY